MLFWKKKTPTHRQKPNVTGFRMAQRVGFEPTGDDSHDGFRVHAVMTASVPLQL